MEIEIKGNDFILLPQKAIYWKNNRTLLISDLHLGKITHFRKAGIALPTDALKSNFSRLDKIMEENEVERIILLGDLFHNFHNVEWEYFSEWREKYSETEIIIVLGNHDIIPLRLYNDVNIIVEDFREIGGFEFRHHPLKNPQENKFIFCGHIHPVFNLRSNTRQSISLPCFIIDKNQAILPSFGVFTGGFQMKKIPGRKIFVIAENEIIKI